MTVWMDMALNWKKREMKQNTGRIESVEEWGSSVTSTPGMTSTTSSSAVRHRGSKRSTQFDSQSFQSLGELNSPDEIAAKLIHRTRGTGKIEGAIAGSTTGHMKTPPVQTKKLYVFSH